ncbi:MAG: glycoside hydrolase family 32 protein [Cellulomonadaceae bacterium]
MYALALCVLLGACTGPEPVPSTPPVPGPSAEQETLEELWRPQFHYSPRTGRLADPNGLVWYDGEWHLFHQQMGTWAHAVSPDLVHWEHLPTALEHDEGGQALSGSVVIDGANTSGLFDPGTGGMVAVYTATAEGEAQALAYSADHGRTWERYDGNPVLPNQGRDDFRDPKVFWHEPTSSWIMVVSETQRIGVYGSPNLREWTYLSDFGPGQGMHSAVWECPDLFPLAVDGDPGNTRWVLTVSVGASEETAGSTAQYFVGDFDGTTFTRDPDVDPGLVQVTDAGQDFYAAQTFEGAPDGRRVWLGWMGNWAYPYAAPTAPWTNAMSVPRVLSLRTDPAGYVLVQTPVHELDALRTDPEALRDVTLAGDLPLETRGTSLEFDVMIELGDADEVGLRVFETRDEDGEVTGAVVVGVDRAGDQLFLDRTEGGSPDLTLEDGTPVPFAVRRSVPFTPSPDGVVRLRGYVDASAVEVFADDGVLAATMVVFPPQGADGVSLYSVGGDATVRSADLFELRSIWR